MSNLKNFDEILVSLELEKEKLHAISGAYQKLQKITEQFAENNKTLEQIIELQKVQQEKVIHILAEIENVNKHNKIELEKLIEEKTEQTRKENKNFYSEFENTVKIKLDDNKSQIKQLIESERAQTRLIIANEFAQNSRELTGFIRDRLNRQTQKLEANQKVIKISLWLIRGLTLLLSAFAVFKLWM